MILKTLFFIFFLFSITAAFCQPTDCLKFRDGKFKIADRNAGSIIISERKGSYQTDSYEALKLVVRFKVNWTSNCSFTLTVDKIIRNDNKVNFPSNTIIKATIIETAQSSYTQETSSSLTNGTTRSLVTLLSTH
jgi:hypothetical protein